MLSTAPSPPSTAPPLSECSSIASCGAILSNAPHLAQSTSLFTTAGDASASDSRASPFSAGVGRIAAAASTAAAKRSIAVNGTCCLALASPLAMQLREPSIAPGTPSDLGACCIGVCRNKGPCCRCWLVSCCSQRPPHGLQRRVSRRGRKRSLPPGERLVLPLAPCSTHSL